MSSTRKSDEEVLALAKKQLRLPPTASSASVPKHFLAELKKHINIFPDDTHFYLIPQPGSTFGIAVCLEEGCGLVHIQLSQSILAADGGRKDGVGSLMAYRQHINDHPTHKSNRRARLVQNSNPLSFPQSSRSNRNSSNSGTPGTAGKSRLKLVGVIDKDGSRSSSVFVASSSSSAALGHSSPASRPSVNMESAQMGSIVPRKRLSEAGPAGHEDEGVPSLHGDYGPNRIAAANSQPGSILVTSSKRLKIGEKIPFSLHDDNRSSRTPPALTGGTSSPLSSLPTPSSSLVVSARSTDLSETNRKLEATIADLNTWEACVASLVRKPRFSSKDRKEIRYADRRIAYLKEVKAQCEARLNASQPNRNITGLLTFALERYAGPPSPVLHDMQHRTDDVGLPSSSPSSACNVSAQMSNTVLSATKQPSFSVRRPPRSPVASSSTVQLPDPPAPLQAQMTHDATFRTMERLSEISRARGLDDDSYGGDENWYERRGDMFQGPVARDEDIQRFFQNAGNAEQFDTNASVTKALKRLKLPNLTTPFPGLEITLMPHQVIGVAWMLDREGSDDQSGILSDEMGLGKTVQMIATVMANRSDDPARKSTLIVAPLALLGQWKLEIEMKTNDGLSVLIYHGMEKAKTKKALQKFDVVLTTFGTLSQEWHDVEAEEKEKEKEAKGKKKKKKNRFIASDSEEDNDSKKKKKKLGLLFTVTWHRVVLDEAQYIRNKRTRISRAVTELEATYRWCLTGTPITNGLEDAFGLLRFSGIRPWCDWTQFNGHIVKNQKREPNIATRRLQAIFATCLLRRKKDSQLDGKKLIDLPPKDVQLVKLTFSPEEQEIYNAVESRSQMRFNRYLRAGTVLKNYVQVLVLLLRLRQICTHTSLITEEDGIIVDDELENMDEHKRDDVINAQVEMGRDFVDKLKAKLKDVALERMAAESQSTDAAIVGEDCPVCFDNFTEPVVTACMHFFCRDCINAVLAGPAPDDGNVARPDERPCPVCRGPVCKKKLFSRAAFEPTDAELNIVKDPVKLEGGENEDISSVNNEDEDMPDIPLLLNSSKKGKERAKSNGKSKVPRKRTKRVVLDSGEEDDEDDDLSDFIAQDDENEANKGERRVHGKRPGTRRTSSIDYRESEGEESDSSDEGGVIFGRKRPRASPTSDCAPIKALSKLLPSTKMKHMMNSLIKWSEDHPDEKTMVISQWTQALDLVSHYLETKGFLHVKFQGNMSREKRDRAVRKFMKKNDATVMLMSLKCGGVGLNLTRANRVISLDLGWSEAVESQAFDRVHRLGQTRPVFVERVVICDTVEDRVLALQEKKRNLADGSLGEGSGKKIGRLSVRELANLFGLDHRGNRLV